MTVLPPTSAVAPWPLSQRDAIDRQRDLAAFIGETVAEVLAARIPENFPALADAEARFIAYLVARSAKTQATYTHALRRFDEYLASIGVNRFEQTAEALSMSILEDFLGWLRGSYQGTGGRKSKRTEATYCAGVRAFWRYLCRHRLAPRRFNFEEMKDNLHDALGKVRYHAPRIDRRLPYVVTYVDSLPVPPPEAWASAITSGALIKTARQRRELTRRELGERLGVSHLDIYHLEAGRSVPYRKTLARVAQALQVDVGELWAPDERALTLLRDRALIHVLFSTGMRREEVCSLDRSHVQDGHSRQAIITGKGDKDRAVFFDEKALAAIQAYLKARADTYAPLFLRHDHRRGKSGPMGEAWRLSPQGLWKVVRGYAQAAGVKAGPHAFRHEKACTLLNRGASLSEVQDILGHDSPDTTKRIYAQYDTAHLQRAFDRYSADADELVADLESKG